MHRTTATFMALSLATALTLTPTALAAGSCPCVTDLNTDGTTNAADLAILLGAWGQRGDGDFDASGTIDAADLAVLLGEWGPCEVPANDQCQGGVTSLFGQELLEPFCTAAATTSTPVLTPNLCGPGVAVGKDIWYRYQPPYLGKLIVETCDADFDTVLAIYLNTQTPQRCLCPFVDFVQVIACNDDSTTCGFQSHLEIDVDETPSFDTPCFTFRVGGFVGALGTAAGSGVLHIRNIREGDRCDIAHELPSLHSVAVSGNTLNDTWLGGDESSCANGDTIDEWYRYEVPCDGTLEISTCHADTDFDTTLAVFTSCGQAQIACNDDSPAPGCQIGDLNRKSRVTISATTGEVIFIRVSGFQGAEGQFRLLINADCVS